MSTILIQKKSESKETLVQQAIKLPMELEKVEPAFKAIDFAGLSWLILEYGDEI